METKNNHSGIRTWIEIDIKALQNNYKTFRGLIDNKCKLMAVVKSNAYGHSLIDFSHEMERLGADYLGVDSITEALALRREGITIPILVLGYTLPEMINKALLDDITLTISCADQMKELKKFSLGIKTPDALKIHIKVDTGMHRQGFYVDQLNELISELITLKHIEIEGIYTHFAAAKNPAFPVDTNKQIDEFNKACQIFKKAGYDKIIRHAAATSGAIVFPASHFDMVRIGIGLYGLWPSVEVKSCYEMKLCLQPVLSWKAIVGEVKEVKKGERVGYDFAETFAEDSKIAIIPIGYWHGFRRNMSSIGQALVGGQKAKILGRVSMDMVVIDITHIKNVKIGDAVTILGKDGKEEIAAEEMARLSDTSWYETITMINPLIKRIYK